MAITTCVVSGTIYDSSGTVISGATVMAYNVVPYFYSDGSLIMPTRVSTTTAANGTWSLTLPENATSSTTTQVSILFTDGNSGQVRKDYQITVPNSGTANFSTLAAGQ